MHKKKTAIYEFSEDGQKISIEINYTAEHYILKLNDSYILFNGHIKTELDKHKKVAELITEALNFIEEDSTK